MSETRAKLLSAAVETVWRDGLGASSARSIATSAGVNQALIFYHFGSVSELVEQASRQALEASIARHHDRLSRVTSLAELLAAGRDLHVEERSLGNVAVMAQLMAGAEHDPVLARAAAHGMAAWTTEIEAVLQRVMTGSPFAPALDIPGLARAVCGAFIGLELFEGADPAGATSALNALASLGQLLEVVDDLGPIARRAVAARLRSRNG